MPDLLTEFVNDIGRLTADQLANKHGLNPSKLSPEFRSAVDAAALRFKAASLRESEPAPTSTAARVDLRTDEDFRSFRPGLWRNAIHEAAHAVLALNSGARVVMAQAGDTEQGGRVRFNGDLTPYADCVLSLAGIAVNELLGQRPEASEASDRQYARAAAERHVAQQPVYAGHEDDDQAELVAYTLASAEQQAHNEVGNSIGKIRALARALFLNEGNPLDEHEILNIVGSN